MKRSIRFGLIVLSILALPGCDGVPPIPIPTPTPAPQTGYDCDNPPAQAGALSVKEPWGDGSLRFVALREKVGARSLASAVGRQAAQAEVNATARRLQSRYRLGATKTLGIVRAFAASMSAETARQILSDPEVLYVEQVGTKRVPEPRTTQRRVFADPAAVKSWGLDCADQRTLPHDDAFDPGADGATVTVANVDTGVDKSVSDIAGRTGACHDSFGGTCADDHDHGTHTIVTAAGAQYGVAKKAPIIWARVLQNGTGSDADVIEGIEWVTDYCQSNGLTCVVNSSIGGDASNTLDRAYCVSIKGGLFHAVAAGNDNLGACGYSPARVKQALTVGASDSGHRMAGFSNEGPCDDIFAPGVAITSLGRGGAVLTWDGTSMATPHVTGVAALLLQKHPLWTPAQVHDWIVQHATPDAIGGTTPGTTKSLLYARED